MSHEIAFFNGIAQYASTQREWHGLGQLMPAGQPIEVWAQQAGMNYKVQRASIRYATERLDPTSATVPQLKTVEDRIVLFRSDSGAPLGVVSDSYKVVQPVEVLEFFKDWASANAVSIESAGVLFGGKRYFATAKLSDGVYVDGHKDKVVPYVLLSTSADGSLATEARWTTVRVVCNNTLRMAMADKSTKMAHRTTHRSKFKADVVRSAVEEAHAEFAAFMQTARTLANVKMLNDEAEFFTAKLFAKGATTPDLDKARETNGFETIMRLFNGAARGGELESVKDTRWAWLNSVTEYADHYTRARTEENRLAASLWGTGDALKQQAFALITA